MPIRGCRPGRASAAGSSLNSPPAAQRSLRNVRLTLGGWIAAEGWASETCLPRRLALLKGLHFEQRLVVLLKDLHQTLLTRGDRHGAAVVVRSSHRRDLVSVLCELLFDSSVVSSEGGVHVVSHSRHDGLTPLVPGHAGKHLFEELLALFGRGSHTLDVALIRSVD